MIKWEINQKKKKKIATYFISCSCEPEAPKGANQTIRVHIVEHGVDIEGNWALGSPPPPPLTNLIHFLPWKSEAAVVRR